MDLSSISRRAFIAAGLALAPTVAAGAPLTRKVVLLGDSITSGFGLPPREALPSRLQNELARLGAPAKVIAAGVDGDTTAGGASRVDRAVPPGAHMCVVALGGNDLLRGEDPAVVRANLQRIIRRLKARKILVVLAGVKVPPLLQGSYKRAFDAAFASVARTEGVPFLPDLLEGVALNPALNQRDGVHPNAEGVAVIARRLAPLVARGLQAR